MSKKYMGSIARLLLPILILITTISPAFAESITPYNKDLPMMLSTDHLSAQSAVLMDGMTGKILFGKDANRRMYPASTTKVMTLMLALESGIDLSMPIIIPQQASQIPSDSTLVPVWPGDQLTFGDLLNGFMLSSGNDGANAVATLVAGSLDAFVERMNKRAEELGCRDTHFVNAHGYHDDDHYTTAADMALITQEALKNDMFKSIVSRTGYTLNVLRDGKNVEVKVKNTNLMITTDSTYYYKDCIGVKTGTHSRAGNCFVGAAVRDGIEMIAVVFNCAQANDRWVDCKRLFEYGYTRYKAYTLDQMFASARSRIASVKVSNAADGDAMGGQLELNIAQISDPNYIRMVEADNDEALESAVEDFVSRSMFTIRHNLVAPVSEGEVVGDFRYVAQSGEVITAVLLASRSIEAAPPRMSIEDVFPFIKKLNDPLVRALIIVVAVLILLLVIAAIAASISRQRRRSEIYKVRKHEQHRIDRAQSRKRIEAKRRRAKYDDIFDDEDDDDYDDFDDEDDDDYDEDHDDYDDFDEYDDYDPYDDDEYDARPRKNKMRR